MQCLSSTFHILINVFKLKHNLFYKAQSQKKLWRRALRPRRFESRWLVLFPPPTSAHTILLVEKLYGSVSGRQAAEKLSGGVKNMRWRNICPGWARVDQNFEKKISKKSHSAKIVAQYRKYPIPNLNTLRYHSISLYITKNTTSIHCRNYTLS